MNDKIIYDMLIIGGGAAGYTAALYAARAGLRAAVIEKLSAGGQMALTHNIENYPGFINGVDGFELSQIMQKQAERFGAETKYSEAVEADLRTSPKTVKTAKGVFYGKTVVIASGAEPKKLGIKNEAELLGKGVSYCATCDGMFYKGKRVVIVGGGDTAVTEALAMSRIAEKVYLVHRRDSLRATKIYHERLFNTANIEFCGNNVVTEFIHDGKITGVKLKNTITNELSEITCDGVFISIGRNPVTDLVSGQLNLDKSGYIIADETTKTNLDGVYAAGDVRTKQLRQIVTAVSDGAMAAFSAEEYINMSK